MVILPELTRLLPQKTLRFEDWPHVRGLVLADPHFNVPARIDCVLGADAYPSFILDGLRKGPDNAPVAQKTVFGWILTGAAFQNANLEKSTIRAFHITTEPFVSSMVSKLWELDSVPCKPHLSEEEKRCEELFKKTHCRNEDGRFVVHLPFARKLDLSNSRYAAQSCLVRSEARFRRDPKLYEAYSKFMKEYIQLDHMELIPTGQIGRPGAYLPHHGVFRPDNPNKIRIFFQYITNNRRQESLIIIIFSTKLLKCSTYHVEDSSKTIQSSTDSYICQNLKKIGLKVDFWSSSAGGITLSPLREESSRLDGSSSARRERQPITVIRKRGLRAPGFSSVGFVSRRTGYIQATVTRPRGGDDSDESSSPDESSPSDELSLMSELKAALGDDPTETKALKAPIHSDLIKSLKFYARKGLPEKEKNEWASKYGVPRFGILEASREAKGEDSAHQIWESRHRQVPKKLESSVTRGSREGRFSRVCYAIASVASWRSTRKTIGRDPCTRPSAKYANETSWPTRGAARWRRCYCYCYIPV
ncbi:unnamed protein product [Trichogramma brassicae]|uniref:Peptidase aspartic putative domain-containing protein n=1 Tax=Trichogramma brassicae TaxID=86971 RepID=A0A6H5IEV9_9HYME|nr:unnamed protein product [Trichogramma brassicae]